VKLQGTLPQNLFDTDPDDWPDYYMEALLKLSNSLAATSTDFCGQLKQVLYYCPSLHHLWKDQAALQEVFMSGSQQA
jgi:hypothetical protein